ncbi:hypothetical protein Lser_V15G25475 [Lactuca serriola]
MYTRLCKIDRRSHPFSKLEPRRPGVIVSLHERV